MSAKKRNKKKRGYWKLAIDSNGILYTKGSKKGIEDAIEMEINGVTLSIQAKLPLVYGQTLVK